MKCFLNRKAIALVGLLALLSLSFSGQCAVYIQISNSGQTSSSTANVSNGIGRTDMNFTSPAGSEGYIPWVSTPGVQTYNDIRAFAVFQNTVSMKNLSTGQSYIAPITCPSCVGVNGSGYLNGGSAVSFPQTHDSYVGMTFYFSASASVAATVFVSLADSHIPAGHYEGTITGSVGQLAEGYSGEYLNYTSELIREGLNGKVVNAIAMKFDIVIPDYTACTTASPLTIDHGSLTPAQVSGNVKTQNLLITCTGPATIKLTMINPRPQVGNGVTSHIQMSSDNVNWAESSDTTLASLGTEIIHFSSTLETVGTIVPQSLRGSTVVTMNYQ